jgi:hypothetical protein
MRAACFTVAMMVEPSRGNPVADPACVISSLSLDIVARNREVAKCPKAASEATLQQAFDCGV